MGMMIDDLLAAHAVTHYGITPLQEPLSFEFYRQWIDRGMHGEMGYLKEHLPLKAEPQSLHGLQLRSALVIAQDYLPHPRPSKTPLELRTALYAQGEDYHFWFKEKLQEIAATLKQQYPFEEFLCFTDSGPILERDLAQQAGLGWVGKNTCTIHPKKGSLFLLGEILTTLNLNSEIQSNPLPDFCGTCTRCIEICPTQALTKPKELDARLCISYWTIESRDVPPAELRQNFQDWFFGCDLCQTVCPWNEKIFQFTKNVKPQNHSNLVADLHFFLTASGKQIEKRVIGTPLKRAGSFGLRRNALIVIANNKIFELKADVEKWKNDLKLGELALWTLEKIN